MNAGHRRAQLLDDPRVKAVEPNRIQCNICEKWLKLNEIMTYAPYNWYKHIERCLERNKYVKCAVWKTSLMLILPSVLMIRAFIGRLNPPSKKLLLLPCQPRPRANDTHHSNDWSVYKLIHA